MLAYQLTSEECSMLNVTLLTLLNFQLLYHLERKKDKKRQRWSGTWQILNTHRFVDPWASWLLHSQSTYFITFFLGCHKRCLFRRVCLCVYDGEYVLHGSVVPLGTTVGLGVFFLQTTTTITILITITCFWQGLPESSPPGDDATSCWSVWPCL